MLVCNTIYTKNTDHFFTVGGVNIVAVDLLTNPFTFYTLN